MYRAGNKSMTEARQEVALLFTPEHADLVEEFTHFVK